MGKSEPAGVLQVLGPLTSAEDWGDSHLESILDLELVTLAAPPPTALRLAHKCEEGCSQGLLMLDQGSESWKVCLVSGSWILVCKTSES